MKFGQQALYYTLLQGNVTFQQKRIRKFNSTQKGKLD
jgi:hypothetical protein